RMNWMLTSLVALFLVDLAARTNGQPELMIQPAERMTEGIKATSRDVTMDFQQHALLNLVGVGREEMNSVLKVLGTMFNFVDIYGRPRYPVMDSYYSWFKWVDRNLPLVMGTYMAPKENDPHDEYAYDNDEDEFDYHLFSPYYEKTTDTNNVIWKDFYRKIYMERISQNGGNRRQGFSCDDLDMYPGYSTIQVDAMGKMFKVLADYTLTPAYEFFMGQDPLHASMTQVDPLRTLTEHLTYLVGLSDGEDSYSFYENRIDAEDRQFSCFDSTARVMHDVMPYGPFLTLSNLVAVGVWMSAVLAPFLGF
ncbi:unnamed protein product, partial [Meganyctiphanes norvegica]